MSSQGLVAWLETRGLAEWASVLLEHHVDVSVLPLLTDVHLREMGLPVGVRLKLLSAVREVPQAQEPRPQIERRHLTVLFADLVGSTSLSRQMDPEALRDLLHVFHGTVNAEVARLDGYVAQYKGDGALVYFGYPQAHEDDTERAVLTALAIMRALAEARRQFSHPISAHIGIATGLAVVGDTFGQQTAHERSAIGETPNLAARLADLASSGDILISAQTAQLAGQQFDLEAIPPVHLKGIDEPVLAFKVIGERDNDSRFSARRGPVRGAMVGRDSELSKLMLWWSMAVQGEGQVVVIQGEAGIGKSRLLHALSDAVAAETHGRLLAQCSPHHVQTGLHPLRRPLIQFLGLPANTTPQQNQDRLQTILGNDSPADLMAAATLLELEIPKEQLQIRLTPLALRQHTLGGLLDMLIRASSAQPVLILLEDVHWIDPTSLELLHKIVPQLASLRVLVVITARPEADLALPAFAHVRHVHLTRLGLPHVRRMMLGLSGVDSVEEEVVERIAIRTDGVPLYVEELYRSLLDGGALVRRSGVLQARPSIAERLIPASLHDSLMARLDRHRTHKELAQSAAVIGREFDVDLLAGVSGLDKPVLEEALRGLEDAEIAHPISLSPHRVYAFRHALLRDAAYESLLIRQRESLHGVVLDAMEQIPATPPEVLARHASAAGRAERAIEHWIRAARQALQKAAFQEAVSHLQEALKLNQQLDPTTEGREQRLDLLLALGQAIIPWKGYSHSETVRVFDQAHELSTTTQDGQRSFWANYARWVVYYVRGEHLTAHQIACQMLASARQEAHSGRELAAVRARGISEMILGQPRVAHESFELASAEASALLDRPNEHRLAVAQRFAADPEIATQFHVALTQWALGFRYQALETSRVAVSNARAMAHVHTLGHALVHGAIVAVVDQDATSALALSSEAYEFATLHGMELWSGYAQILRGFSLAQLGLAEPGVDALVAGLARMAHMETGTMVPVHHAVCAWGLATLGRREEAVGYSKAVSRELRQGCERYFWPEMLIWHARFQALTPGGADGDVETTLRMALDEARGQGAPGMVLRVAQVLGVHLVDRGRLVEADRCLTSAVEDMPTRDQGPAWGEALSLLKAIHERRESGQSPSERSP